MVKVKRLISKNVVSYVTNEQPGMENLWKFSEDRVQNNTSSPKNSIFRLQLLTFYPECERIWNMHKLTWALFCPEEISHPQLAKK